MGVIQSGWCLPIKRQFEPRRPRGVPVESGGREQTKEGGLRGDQPFWPLPPGRLALGAVRKGISGISALQPVTVHDGPRSGPIYMVTAVPHLWFETATETNRRIQDMGSRRR